MSETKRAGLFDQLISITNLVAGIAAADTDVHAVIATSAAQRAAEVQPREILHTRLTIVVDSSKTLS